MARGMAERSSVDQRSNQASSRGRLAAPLPIMASIAPAKRQSVVPLMLGYGQHTDLSVVDPTPLRDASSVVAAF